AGAAAVAAKAATGILLRSSLQTIDAQAKLAQSLETTTESVQVLARAGDMAGLGFGEVEGALLRVTRRLSLAAAGTGPAADALARLGFEAGELEALPLDARIIAIQEAIDALVPASERAGVASRIFGDRAGVVIRRLDAPTIRQAARDVADFGVAVADVDADRIEVANDAFSRLGLVWTGLGNRLAAAAAPGLQAVADALAEVARRTGPLGRAIDWLGENVGRIASTAAAFAGFMAGRWVAGLAAAALSVRGLATALVVMRGALIRTGIGALIVGAGEMVFQFSRLVAGAGGFGEAMGLLGDVAKAAWEGIRTGGAAVGRALDATSKRVQQGWLVMIAAIQRAWADFLHDVAGQLRGIEALEESYVAVANAAIMAGSAVHETELAATEAARGAELSWREAGEMLAGAFDGVRPALAAIGDAARRSGEETEGAAADAADGVKRITDALEDAEAQAGRTGAGVRSAAETATEATRRLADATERAADGWVAIGDAARDYAGEAGTLGADVGERLADGFRSAEQVVADFVERGKVDFRSLVTSMIADLARLAARQFVLGPIAAGLGAMFSAAPLAAPLPVPRPVAHAGGVAGRIPATRLVPDAAFLGAQRLHGGGIAGLRSDEVPTILLRGERVLSRAESRDHGRPVVVNITTPDAESFRRARTQVGADIARAVALGRRGL
ncbi:MAG: phage tail tape measure C-terminal domain-containing protein, partial [Paracoccaceae bacterium]